MASSTTETTLKVQMKMEHIRTALTKGSVVIKAICAGLLLFYFFSIFIEKENLMNALSVTPGLVFPPSFHVWTLLTHPFVEIHIWNALVGVLAVAICGKFIEPVWGALQMLIFFALITVGSSVMSSLVYLFIYMGSSNIYYLFDTHFYGMTGTIAGTTVALKQLIGDQELPTGPLKLYVKDIPLLYLLMSVILKLVGLVSGTHPCFVGSGIFVAWVYLRFYQKQSDGKILGDMCDHFSFASFFPEIIRPPIAVFSNTVHGFLVKIKVCKKQVRKYDVGAPSAITITLPGTDPADAERRRQLALKALNERLTRVEQQTEWPSMDDQPSTSDDASQPPSLKEEAVADKQDVLVDIEGSATGMTST
ncbi:transmembrane protein 115-like [Antedon mediterranea]|uniref:transmembrane protein 115-like n=1 Tax=Antedon mediterranea TaxID=105859 RepID=UPI003AF40B84